MDEMDRADQWQCKSILLVLRCEMRPVYYSFQVMWIVNCYTTRAGFEPQSIQASCISCMDEMERADQWQCKSGPFGGGIDMLRSSRCRHTSSLLTRTGVVLSWGTSYSSLLLTPLLVLTSNTCSFVQSAEPPPTFPSFKNPAPLLPPSIKSV